MMVISLPKFMKGVVKSTAVLRSCVMVRSHMARSALWKVIPIGKNIIYINTITTVNVERKQLKIDRLI